MKARDLNRLARRWEREWNRVPADAPRQATKTALESEACPRSMPEQSSFGCLPCLLEEME